MPVTIDARGKACPQPVIMTRKALAESPEVTVIVDNTTARENVTGMARSQGHTVSAEEQSDGIYIHISKGGAGAAPTLAPAAGPALGMTTPAVGPLVLFIGADTVGRGSEELGAILMRTLVHTLTEAAPCPETIVFMNAGVRLVAEGSPVLDDLRILAARGVQLLACGTCLGYYELTEKVAVGTISNMYTIAETLLGAGKVVAI